MRLIAVAGLAVALSGCIVAVRGPGGPHPSAGHVQYSAWDETEVHYVIFRDFFGCSDRDVWRLTAIRRLYSLDAADLFFLMFVSRHVSVSFDVVFRAWWDTCRRDHHRLVVLYRLSPTIFFVPVPAHVQCPPPYGRAYGYWRNRTLGSASLTADEYRSLVAMKVACDYYGHAPVHFFDRVKAVGAPEKVIYADHRHAGRGGEGCAGTGGCGAGGPAMGDGQGATGFLEAPSRGSQPEGRAGAERARGWTARSAAGQGGRSAGPARR
jgi:hypothetical protein